MSAGNIVTYGLFVGAILFPQASSDDLRKLYSQGNQKIVQQESQFYLSDIQDYPSLLQKFVLGPRLPVATHQDLWRYELTPQAASEQNINDSKTGNGSSGLSKKQWYIIGGTILIVLVIVATVLVVVCNKKMKKKHKKKMQSFLTKGVQVQQQLSDPPFQLEARNLQPDFTLPDVRTAMEEGNIADSINFQENLEQNFGTKPTLQEIHASVTILKEIGKEPSQRVLAASSKSLGNNETVADVHTTEVKEPIVDSATKTMQVINNTSSAGQDINVSKEHRQFVEEHINGDTRLYKNEVTPDKEHNVIAKLPRKRYDSESVTSDIDPRIRDKYIRREHDRGYDSDQRRRGHDNAAYDYYSEPRIHDHNGIPRLESRRSDQRFAYDEERIRYPKRSEIHSTDHLLHNRHETPRRTEEYGEIDASYLQRDNDPRKYYPKYDHQYDDRYSQRPYTRYDNSSHMNRHSRYNDHEDYNVATIKDSRFKDPFSRDVRHELGAVIARDSFNQNDRLMNVADAPVRRDSYTIYTSPRSPQKEHVKEIERQLIRKINNSASPMGISLPKPDYQEEILESRPYKKPPVVHPRPVVQTVVKPREFKGPYGPDDLDAENNPYTLARGKTHRPAIDNAE